MGRPRCSRAAHICQGEGCLVRRCGAHSNQFTLALRNFLTIVCQAHAMTPHVGAGAGQGIEDVYLLSQLLSHPQTTTDNIEVR